MKFLRFNDQLLNKDHIRAVECKDNTIAIHLGEGLMWTFTYEDKQLLTQAWNELLTYLEGE